MRKRFRVSIPELLRSVLLGVLCGLAACEIAGPHAGAAVSLILTFGLMAAYGLLSILILIDRWEG
ncbi:MULTISPECIES: hypothetical protein [Acetobacteraceae]|uniref:Uncharacterized protein n=1 Tax=Komagataeibacter europaeus NBRC 3261 TaxID=1234669 RepID=A0A0D6Q121_KOMEU|nr:MULTISPECIES: hypothetical protein [Acetobacteraceae]GAN96690.1 hypothetical protein Geu3261_0090_036 [Komagataeibacter europaeus NBRC 3261]